MKKKEKQYEPEPVKSFCLNKISEQDAKAKTNKDALNKISELLKEAGVGGSVCLSISSNDVKGLIVRVKYLLFDLEASKRENKYFRAMLERGE